MKNPIHFTSNMTPLSLKNLGYNFNDVNNAIKISKTPDELLQNLKKARIFLRNLEIDKTTKTYVRIKGKDLFGNIEYVQAEFDTDMPSASKVNFKKML